MKMPFWVQFFFAIFGGHKSFLWGTHTPVLGFWWHLPWVSKPGWIPWVLSHLCDPQIHLWHDTCWLYRGQHGSLAFSIHVIGCIESNNLPLCTYIVNNSQCVPFFLLVHRPITMDFKLSSLSWYFFLPKSSTMEKIICVRYQPLVRLWSWPLNRAWFPSLSISVTRRQYPEARESQDFTLCLITHQRHPLIIFIRQRFWHVS